MLTLFTTAKPFKGHNDIIQRNALKSWTMLDRDIEIIVFGDDEGAAEVCAELGIRHEPIVERNEFGTILVRDMFARAQAIARHDVLCYINCDIILLGDFCRALGRVRDAHREFLMIGQRWDANIAEPLPFAQPDWESELRDFVERRGKKRRPDWIDYFAFSRGLYGADMPPFAIGRTSWDNWLVWKALDSKKPVVDATPMVLAVHQNHDYGHYPGGAKGVWKGDEARRNFELAGRWAHYRTIAGAVQVLKDGHLKNNPFRHWVALAHRLRVLGWEAERVLTYKVCLPLWHFILGITRPVRTMLGLRSKG